MITEEQKIKAEELYEKHAKMATYYASKFYKYISYGVLTKEDLDQTAALSLWKACLSFDETKGFKFYTYCSRILLNELVLFKNKSFKYDNEAYISYNAKISGGDDTDASFLDVLGDKYFINPNHDNLETDVFLQEVANHISSFLTFENKSDKIAIIEKLFECYNVKELTTIFDFTRKDVIYCQKLLKYVILNYKNCNNTFTVKYKIYNENKDYVSRSRYLLRRVNYEEPDEVAYSILINNNLGKLVKKLKQGE